MGAPDPAAANQQPASSTRCGLGVPPDPLLGLLRFNMMKVRCSHGALTVCVSEQWVDVKVALRWVIFTVPDHVTEFG